jgi:integrase
MPTAARKIALTDRSLQAMKPPPDGRRMVVWDSLLPGLAVRISAKGKLSFYAVRRRSGAAQPSWVLLGAYPLTTLADARSKAREALGALIAGEDPATLAEAKRRPGEEAEAGTFGAIAERFIKQHVATRRSARSYEALIRRELIPVLGDRPIAEIRRRDIIALIDGIVARGAEHPGRLRPKSGGEYAARHALAAAKKMFNWAIGKDVEGLAANPCNLVKVTEESPAPRDRVLSDDELRVVWRGAEATPYPFGDLIRALLMTGQRLREISEARWCEIEGSFLRIPAARMKGKAAHVLPLTDRMKALLDGLPRFTGGDFLFTTTAGRRPISGYSKLKARFDRTVAEIGPVAHFTLHDLRRSMRTGLAQAGVSVFVAELIIAHRQSGVHGTYDLHRYDVEMLAGLRDWEMRLAAIVIPEPSPPNVVALRPEAAA